MNIVEAIKATSKDAPYITRQKWETEFDSVPGHRILLMPTDTPDCIIGISRRDGIRSYPRWNPAKGDLLADDWITVGPSLTSESYEAFVKAGMLL